MKRINKKTKILGASIFVTLLILSVLCSTISVSASREFSINNELFIDQTEKLSDGLSDGDDGAFDMFEDPYVIPHDPNPLWPGEGQGGLTGFLTASLGGEQFSPAWSGVGSLPTGFGLYSAIWPAGSWHTTTSDPMGDLQITGIKLFCFLRFPIFNPGPFNAQVDGLITTTWDQGGTSNLVLDFDVAWGGWTPGCYFQYLFTMGQIPIYDLWDPYDSHGDVGIESIHVDLDYREHGILIHHYDDTFYDVA